ncbi:hypothetical protein BJ508DRAFT_419247 [Ascobolus immersus RN42]|uniref:Uncharacterized protein n=1 Tax=Ascobolus immersus RN42 TaxID=1160509 RepID=A0A3N4HFE2_ASCIM|nr:hypothetical protein BJ508DRAFT_419247 [Ascobolus immersus RN42]
MPAKRRKDPYSIPHRPPLQPPPGPHTHDQSPPPRRSTSHEISPSNETPHTNPILADRRPLPPQEKLVPDKQQDRTGRSFGGYSKLRTNARGEPLWLSSMALKREEEQMAEERKRKLRTEERRKDRRKLNAPRNLDEEKMPEEGTKIEEVMEKGDMLRPTETTKPEETTTTVVGDDDFCHPDRKPLLAGEDVEVRHYEPAQGRNDQERPSPDYYRPKNDENVKGDRWGRGRGRRSDEHRDSPPRGRRRSSSPPSRGEFRFRREASRSPVPLRALFKGRDVGPLSPPRKKWTRASPPSPSRGRYRRRDSSSPPPRFRRRVSRSPPAQWYRRRSPSPSHRRRPSPPPVQQYYNPPHLHNPYPPPPAPPPPAVKEHTIAKALLAELRAHLPHPLPQQPLDAQTRLRMPPHQRPPAPVTVPLPPYPPPPPLNTKPEDYSLNFPSSLPFLPPPPPIPLGPLSQDRLNINHQAASNYLATLARMAGRSGPLPYVMPD